MMASFATDMSVVMAFAGDVARSTVVPGCFSLDGKDKGKESSKVGKLHFLNFMVVEKKLIRCKRDVVRVEGF